MDNERRRISVVELTVELAFVFIWHQDPEKCPTRRYFRVIGVLSLSDLTLI